MPEDCKTPTRDLLERLISEEIRAKLQSEGIHVRVEAESEVKREALVDILAQIQQSEQQTRRLAQAGQVGAGLVHEARNGLSSVKGFAELLQQGSVDAKQEKRLQVLSEQANRVLELLSRYLSIARNQPARREPMSLSTCIERVLLVATHQLRLHDVRIQSPAIEENIWVIGSSAQIEQVALNILINAQEAMQGPGSVSVQLWQSEGQAWLRFKDDGPGMSPETLGQIFNPFFTTKVEGNGIGLSLSRRLIEEHGGSLQVESALGEGTTMTLTLPLAEVPA